MALLSFMPPKHEISPPPSEKERPKVPCYILNTRVFFRNGALRRAGAYWKIQSFLGLVFVFLVC